MANVRRNNSAGGNSADDQVTGVPGLPRPAAGPRDPDATFLGNDSDITIGGADPDITYAGNPDIDATRLPTAESAVTTFANRAEDVTYAGGNNSTPYNPPGSDAATMGPDVTPPEPGQDTGPLPIGSNFGTRYHIMKVLGVGGMGAVYKAYDSELGVAVAVKVIRPEIAANPEAANEIERRFKRELLLARQVTHPNVVRIHDLGDINGIKYITMPFIDGADLASILSEQKRLPVDRALRIARGVVAGLVSAHQAGVVHRDLKPANIMIGPNDVPTIMDFGIARSADAPQKPAVTPRGVRPTDLSRTAGLASSSTQAGAIVGTVAYMAPEQASGQPVDQRADLYAFGLILYDMLIGGRRRERATSAIAELQERIKTAPPAPRTIDGNIPAAVDDIIKRCLEPDPANRFPTSLDLQKALDRLDEKGMPLPIMRRVSRRTMTVAAVLVVAALAATWYATKWFVTPDAPRDPVAVLIADFQNNTGDAAFDRTLEQTVRRGLEGASFISAYDRSRIRASLGVPAPPKLDDVAARELAVKHGIGVLLAGVIESRGSGYEISVKATHPVTGEVISETSTRAADKNGVLEAAANLMATVRRDLGDRTSTSDQLFAMRSISTSSLDVVSHYANAVEAQARGNFEEAHQEYLEAVKLDPQFGLGYQGLAAMSRNLGRLDDADKYIKEAFRYVDGMTEREKFATRGYYYRTLGDIQQCAKEYEELLKQFPGDTVAHNQRAGCLYRLRQVKEATEEMRRAVDLLPNHSGYRTNLALFAALSGDFEGAEAEVNRLEQKTDFALQNLAYSQLGRGMVAEASGTYRTIGSKPAGESTAAAGLADIAMYEGRYTEAIRILEQAAAADLAAKNPARAAIKYTSIGYAHLTTGRSDLAIAAAEKAVQNSRAMAVRYLASRIFIEAGASDKAQPIATALAAEFPAEPQAYGKLLQGLQAYKSGNAVDAIKILSEANGILDTWFGHFDLGRAFLAAKQLPQADSEFDRCIARRGEALSLMDEGPTYGYFPPAFYYQGLVRQGLNTANYANAYREYLKIRGESKEDPLVPETRKRAGN